jgi:site-specific DNA-methyltransferase (adenine-specific)
MNITNEDNMQLMVRYEDNYFDLAIVDPPYGIKESGGRNRNSKKGDSLGLKTPNYIKKYWDKKTPDKSFFDELIRVSKNQIIWGGNYFIDKLYPTPCMLVWDKKVTAKSDFADCELAWTSFSSAVRKFQYGWIGFDYLNNKERQKKIHPTEKPIKLYEWLLMNYAKEGDKILDTHLGSGSIAIACHNLGFDLTACELDKDYYDDAIKRLNNHKKQLKLL